MNRAARVWDNAGAADPAASKPLRHVQYEQILGQIATGVFILEPTRPGDALSLEITFVNEMGANFFGKAGASVPQVLADASH